VDWAPLRVGLMAFWRPEVAVVLVLVGAAAVAAVHGRPAGRKTAHRSGRWPERQAGRTACFLMGLAATYAALAGPVHVLARQGLLSAELAEAGLLVYVAVPLLLCGAPLVWLNRILVRPAVRQALRVLTRPIGAALVMNVLLLVYAAGLAARADPMPLSPWAADLADLALCIAAAASWWPVLGVTADVPALGDLAQVVYLLLNWLAVTGLSAYVLLGGAPGGAAAAAAARTGLPWGLTPLVDRQVGGVVFSVLSHAAYAVATALALLRWVRRENLTASVPQMYQRLRAAGFDDDEARRVANLDVDLDLELEPGAEP
jgi:cytochrome c oxidase assembly factor CtaG